MTGVRIAPMLYVFGGLPGTGKSTLALRLARDGGAFYLRIDTIEDALGATGPEGYVAAYRIAVDNLRLGRSVIADCVNPVRATREAWRAVAAECEVPIVEIEVVCSDRAEHRRRLEARSTGGVRWSDVLRKDYDPWDSPPLVLDTAASGIEASYAALRRLLHTAPSAGVAWIDLAPTDVDAFVPVFVDAFGAPPWNVRWCHDAAAERLAAFAAHPRFRGLGLYVDDEPAALALGWGERWTAGWVFHIKELCVAPGRQGRGIGTGMLRRFEKTLEAEGYAGFYLETSSESKSRDFYEKSGYDALDLVSLRKRLK